MSSGKACAGIFAAAERTPASPRRSWRRARCALRPERRRTVADYSWPAAADRKLIGSNVLRIDAPLKVSGKAQYTTDYNLPGMLFATTVRCPYAHAKIASIDTTAAEKSPGCKAIYVIQKAGTEIFWVGDDIVAVAAVDEFSAAQAAKAVNGTYQELTHLVVDSNPDAPAGFSQPMKPETLGDSASAFQQAKAV